MAKAVAMLVAMALVVAVMNSSKASADNCDPGQLAECMPAINNGSTPTTGCCSKLHAQESCYCKYAQNPAFAKYFKGGIASRMLTACDMYSPVC
jgi:hypothetical protein